MFICGLSSGTELQCLMLADGHAGLGTKQEVYAFYFFSFLLSEIYLFETLTERQGYTDILQSLVSAP